MSPPQAGPGPLAPTATVPAGPDPVTGPDAAAKRDWRWVEEWQARGERPPWAPGVSVAVFIALLIGTAVFVLCDGLADRPVVDVAVNLIVAGGLAPAVWLSRGLPVLRWFAAGAVVGVVGAWLGALVFLF